MIGDRMRQARLAAGMTLDEVVGQLATLGQPLTKAGLSKYEMNRSTPGATTLLRLAHVFGVRSAYFTEEPSVSVAWVAFRKQTRLPKGRQEQIKAYASNVVESQCWLRGIFYPDESPRLPTVVHVRTPDDAERGAEQLRLEWALGDLPVESVARTLEDRGCVIVPWDADEGKFDGLSGWANGSLPVLVFNQAVSLDRQRFNLAHELGHMVMECANLPDKDQEGLAHRFASAFLLPRDVARRELGTKRRHIDLHELGLLKRRYGLSMQSCARRALDADIIDAGYFRRLCIEFSARGWRKREPVEFKGDEEPTRLKQMTLRALAEGLITRDRASQLCPGCIEQQEPTATVPAEKELYLTAVELMRLPKKDRERIMAAAAVEAEADYRSGSDLREFEAFGDDDFYNETP